MRVNAGNDKFNAVDLNNSASGTIVGPETALSSATTASAITAAVAAPGTTAA